MPDPETPEPPASKAGSRTLRRMCIMLGILFSLGGGYLWWDHELTVSGRELFRHAESQIAALQPEPIPNDENAALIYNRAFALIGKNDLRGSSKTFYDIVQGKVPADSPEVDALLKANKPALDALAEAADKTGCDFKIGYTSMGTNIPSLIACRASSCLLGMATIRAAREGRNEEAARDLELSLQLARGVGHTKILIGHMIGVACEEISLQSLREVLDVSDPDEKTLSAMLAALDEHLRQRPSMLESFRAETAMSGWVMAKVASGGVERDWFGNRFKPYFLRISGRAHRDVRLWTKMSRELEGLLALPCPERWEALRKANPGGRIPQGSMLEIFCPSWLAAPRNDATVLARVQCARLAVGCRLYRLKRGSYPETLADLSAAFPERFGELPGDPFRKGPLLYKRTEKGLVVYSVGEDGKDDGGLPEGTTLQSRSKYWDGPDLPFEVRR